jgi:hypothetical protein
MSNNRELIIQPDEVVRIPRTPDEAIKRLNDVLFRAQQETLTDAMLADLVDSIVGLVPILGDTMELTRVGHSLQLSDEAKELRTILTVIDTLIGVVPVIGDILDFLLPANTINFFGERMYPKTRQRIIERIKAIYGPSLGPMLKRGYPYTSCYTCRPIRLRTRYRDRLR